jgi:hypothetical protein
MIFFRISTPTYPMACSEDILKEFGHCFDNNGVLWLLIICLMMFLCHPQLMASDILIFTCVGDSAMEVSISDHDGCEGGRHPVNHLLIAMSSRN